MLEAKNLMYNGDNGDSRFPFSRDFAMSKVSCGVVDCVANDGKGKCVMPSLIKINRKKKCKGYRKSTNTDKVR